MSKVFVISHLELSFAKCELQSKSACQTIRIEDLHWFVQ